jgi:hypothetical protein
MDTLLLIFEVTSKAILNQLWNSLGEPELPTIQCIIGPFKDHCALYDWGARVNIMSKIVYDCLDEDPLVPVSCCLELADSIEL